MNCTNIETLIIGGNIEQIGNMAFIGCTKLETLTIGGNVKEINYEAFSSCTNLKTLTLGESIENIGREAFYKCNNLVEITWNAVSVQDFYESSCVFGDAGSAGDGIVVRFGEKVQRIPDYCFYSKWFDGPMAEHDVGWVYNSAKVRDVYIGDSVTTIGVSAFSDCYMLQKVYLGNNAVCEDSSTFTNCENITEVHFNGNAEQWLERSFGEKFGMSEYNLYIEGELLTEYTFMSNVTNYAFRGCQSLQKVVISDSVEIIGYHAFYNCAALSSLVLGKNVKTLGSSAFYNCQSLTNIVWNAVNVSNLFTNVFYNIGTAEEDTFVAVTFGDDVQQIPQSLFAGSSRLRYVVLGSGIKELGSAFENCTNLTHIFYHGNKAQWEQLQSGLEAQNATVYYYSVNNPYASQPDDPDSYWHYNEQTAAPSVWARLGGGE